MAHRMDMGRPDKRRCDLWWLDRDREEDGTVDECGAVARG